MAQSGFAYRDSDDTRLAKLAARQHGVVAAWQLWRLGYTRAAIHRRVKAGRLHPVHRGVYAVGYDRLTARGRWMAAVLACGPGAALSHAAAAALWGLRPVPSGPVDVISPGRHAIPGIRCHHAHHLDPADVTRIDGIPVTSIERLMLDLAETLHRQRLREVLEAAQRQDLLDLRKLDALVRRSPGRRGLKPLTEGLAELRDEPPWTQSELERAFRRLVQDAHLPEPRLNVIVDGELVDAYWPEHNLVVEVDGWRFHKTKRAFEADRRKDARPVIAGRRVVRFSAERVFGQPAAVARELSLLLDGAPPLSARTELERPWLLPERSDP